MNYKTPLALSLSGVVKRRSLNSSWRGEKREAAAGRLLFELYATGVARVLSAKPKSDFGCRCDADHIVSAPPFSGIKLSPSPTDWQTRI
jgi:hypothetical protein